MLVKLAFVMQRLKKYLKKIFVMISKDGGDNFWILWGDTAVIRRDIELIGGPTSPPTRENPDVPYNSPEKICYISPHHQYSNIFVNYK